MPTIQESLQKFKKQYVSGKGDLSVVLVVTREARDKGLPLDSRTMKTEGQGQVKGLGRSSVQKILNEHGVTQILAAEGGRTSRGSLALMEKYVKFLNQQNEISVIDLPFVESWWVDRVKEFFAGRPFKFRADPSKSIAYVVRDLLNQAEARQRENQGTMFQGALMQHLVGAKLTLALPDNQIQSCGFSVKDEANARAGDFIIGDVVIHVTATPTEMLLRKCADNLNSHLKPIIVTSAVGVVSGQSLAKPLGIEGRVDFFDIEQFIAMNIYEISRFLPDKRDTTVVELIRKYNKIVEECETDYGMLQIKLS
ncbi:MAG: DUF4928 family protein [Dehalococcoidia bacterium]|jgi:hypothetical protein